MRQIATHVLLETYHHPLTHPVVIEQVRVELARRGVFPRPRNESLDHVLQAARDLGTNV